MSYLKKNQNAARPAVFLSGVTFVLFCFVSFPSFLLSLKPRPFVQSFSRSIIQSSFVLRSSMCMRPDRHTQLPSNYCLRPFSFLFLLFFVSLETDVPFSEYFCTITTVIIFLLRRVHRTSTSTFFLPDGTFLSCDHGLDFDLSANYYITGM